MPEENAVAKIEMAIVVPAKPSPWPVSELRLVLKACNPSTPVSEGDDSRYVDLTLLRDNNGIKPLERRLLMELDENTFHHQLLCGHRGSGKSSELLSLEKWANAHGFLAVRTEVDDKYGGMELEYSDLILLAIVITEKSMKDFGHPLPQDKISRFMQWFRDTVVENSEEQQAETTIEAGVQVGGLLPFSIGGLFAKLTARYRGSSAHTIKTRETLRRDSALLLELSIDLLNSANELLASNDRPRGLLLIFDNMDRYDPLNIETALLNHANHVKQLACHAVFTFPISLVYNSEHGRIGDDYGIPRILPMLALRTRMQKWESRVVESEHLSDRVKGMLKVLEERLDVAKIFDNNMDAELLVKMSGGAIRDLIQLVSLAANNTMSDTNITTVAVHKAIDELRGIYMRQMTISPHDYLCLAQIALKKELVDESSDFGKQINRLLFNGCLLEYSDNDQPWYGVHPLLIETDHYRNACSSVYKKTNKSKNN